MNEFLANVYITHENSDEDNDIISGANTNSIVGNNRRWFRRSCFGNFQACFTNINFCHVNVRDRANNTKVSSMGE